MSDSSLSIPSCPLIEQSLVSTLLQYPAQTAPLLAGARVGAEEFFDSTCRTLVAEIMRRWMAREPIDWISVSHAVSSDVPLAKTTSLATGPAILSAVDDWLYEIKDCALRREIIRSCTENAKAASDGDGRSALASITHDVSILGRVDESGGHSIKEGLSELLRSFRDGDVRESIKTGWDSLDRISPVRRGDMVVVAAQAKGGKSTLALSYMAEVCRRGLPALLLSLEMPVQDIIEKMLAREARIGLDTMYSRTFSDGDVARMARANENMGKWRADIRSDCHDLPAIIATARNAAAQRPGLALIIVDYLQLVRGPSGDSREREVAEVSRSLRLLAMELNCVVVSLSQLNDEGKLRESRAIGQDATAVWMLDGLSGDEQDNVRTLKVPIQRNGQSGVSCELEFIGRFAHFGPHASH